MSNGLQMTVWVQGGCQGNAGRELSCWSESRIHFSGSQRASKIFPTRSLDHWKINVVNSERRGHPSLGPNIIFPTILPCISLQTFCSDSKPFEKGGAKP